MDKVFIESLTVDCVIGVHDWERHVRQRLLISLELSADLSGAATSDDLSETIDYAAVAETVVAMATRGTFQLLESLAQRIAMELLDAHPIDRIRVTIRKPSALRMAESVGIQIERERIR